jgi:ABC-type molybdate transport system permease subunit
MARGGAIAARLGGHAVQPAAWVSVAWLLARGRFRGKSLLNGLVHLPLILPPVVTGYLLLLTFGRRGPIGSLPGPEFRHRLLPSAGPARRWPAGSWPFR